MFPEDSNPPLPQPDEVLLCTETTPFEQVGRIPVSTLLMPFGELGWILGIWARKWQRYSVLQTASLTKCIQTLQ